MLEGKRFAPRSPAAAVKAGLGFVPEERRAEGLILSKSLAFNLGLANLDSIVLNPMLPLISGRRRRALAERTIRDLAIKTAGIENSGRQAKRRQPAKGRHRTMAAVEAEGAHPG